MTQKLYDFSDKLFFYVFVVDCDLYLFCES